MHKVICLYCGASIPDHLTVCPECGAKSHFQKRGFRPETRRRFMVFFILLASLSLLVAFLLPR